MHQNIRHVLQSQAEHNPDSLAILAPERNPLTYGALYLQVELIVKQLIAHGIHRGDRVAIVMPNGPEMATAFLGVASGATSAPLNPAYRATEFDFYLSDLNAKALLIQSGWDSPARASARARSIPIIEVSCESGNGAGLFSFSETQAECVTDVVFSAADDVALVLHTSGTTSRPKLVPLTHFNLCASADHIRTTLQLTAHDRCLNVMPLFHIHGLMASLLSTLSAGASVVCTPGFQADHFFKWLEAFHPTWYTAVPTMHQTILSRAAADREAIAKCPLRFVRSSSASLPPAVMKGLEEAFGAPVIEAYGMTEASHQMASNPLPPLQRQPGTVGLAAGPQIRIIDEAGNALPAGQKGEIAIRGENVTSGYDIKGDNNPTANQTAFINGWFRTGDQGVMDADGYITITGRLKEMVNRGGEKIAPREVDEALLGHPEVVQAVAFAVPHPTLGEDLAAAVVLQKNAQIGENDLRQFAFSRLADHKVPSRIIIVDQIPMGPSGKLQRIGLADKLAPQLKAAYTAPRDPLEKKLARIWENVLKNGRVGIHDNFFALGGDSLLAVSVLLEMEKRVGRELESSVLFHAPTIEQLSAVIRDGPKSSGERSSTHTLPLRLHGSKKPFFLVPGHGGDVFTYVALTRHLHPEQPVHVFQFPERARRDKRVANALIKEMAGLYIGAMRAIQPEGPYNLGGFCFGGELAFEMAQQLRAQRQETGLVAIIYTHVGDAAQPPRLRTRAARHYKTFVSSDAKGKVACVAHVAKNAIRFTFRPFVSPPPERTYVPNYFPGRLTLFEPIEGPIGGNDPYMGWQGLADGLEAHSIPGSRDTIFREPHVRTLAERLQFCLDEAT